MPKKNHSNLGADAILDHVAVAVTDLELAVATYEKIGLKFEANREEVLDQGVKTAFASLNESGEGHLELLGPLNEKSSVFQFIQKKGAGIHHLCFRVSDVKKKCEELKKEGMTLIYPEPVKGARNCLVNFIHPKSTGGVLIEISQHGDEKKG